MDPAILDKLCPMHLALTSAGQICHAGPTLRRLVPRPILGLDVLEVFTVQRPQAITTGAALVRHTDCRLGLTLRDDPETRLRGALVGGGGPDTTHPVVINLAFGMSVGQAVARFGLTDADFAPTDLTIELLYLMEANTLAMQAAMDMTHRLQHARLTAEEQSFTDTLTGLANRRALDAELAAAVAGSEGFALVMMDLDHFKQVNDTLGHAAGDHVLRHVAQILREETRGMDVIARAGGDEFVLLLRRLTDPETVNERLTQIISRVAVPSVYAGAECGVGASMGWIVATPSETRSADELLSSADRALYVAKGRGRGCSHMG